MGETERLMTSKWYLVRTKAGEEQRAIQGLKRCSEETFLPLVKTRIHRWGKIVESVAPLFTCYLFARIEIENNYNQVRHTSGVQYIVQYGGEFALVPPWMIDDLKTRCINGPLRLSVCKFQSGDMVRVVKGPFQQFDGIFERQLSSTERVAILLSVMGAGTRVVLSADMIEKAS
jgi:transcription elongation factor/antiterminator RfaH